MTPEEQDHAFCWHPFTDQEEWERSDPLILERGEGVWLYDRHGRRYFDGNSSIWTNIHGHGHPTLVEALRKQAGMLCHSSYLGAGHLGAGKLAEKLCQHFPTGTLARCFFSDNGSTALEVALKMSLQWRAQNGEEERTGVVAFERAYHGDTLGAASVGGVSRFLKGYGESGLSVLRVGGLEDLRRLPENVASTISALVIEPLVQGVNQMRHWPSGMLAELRAWCDQGGVHLILDEVMTGFGRTGKMFACQHEGVVPDFLCLAKGLTGGTMPLAATLTTEKIYEGFKGGAERTFYYGHSYTANALGCAVALASLQVFEETAVLAEVTGKGAWLAEKLAVLSPRCLGLILAFEVEDGLVFCRRLREKGVLTRNILTTVVLMPPLCSTQGELEWLAKVVLEVWEESEAAGGRVH